MILLDLATLILPLAGGYAMASFGAPWGHVGAVLSLLFAAACQGAARLHASPWNDFQGIDGDD